MKYQYILDGTRGAESVRAQLVATTVQEAIKKAQDLLRADSYEIISVSDVSHDEVSPGFATFGFSADGKCEMVIMAKSEKEALSYAQTAMPASKYQLTFVSPYIAESDSAKLPHFSFKVKRNDLDATFSATMFAANEAEAINKLKTLADGEYVCVYVAEPSLQANTHES